MSPPRKILQTSIPTIGALCEKLGYGKGKNELTGLSKNDLTETTQVWRKKYMTSGGKPGRELKDWKSAAERQELLVMATKYLDDGNGERFWPSNRADDIGKQLRYSTDGEKIAKVLRQLFWKQNYYDVHNAREERKRASRERSTSGLTSNDPIIVESDIAGIVGQTPPPKYTERPSQEQNLSTKWSHDATRTTTRPSKATNRPTKKNTIGSFPNRSERECRLGKKVEQETPNVYDDIEGGNEAPLPRRLFSIQTPLGASAVSSGNNHLNFKSTRDQQGRGGSPSEGRAAKRHKNNHRDDTTRQASSQSNNQGEFGTPLRQSERTPKRRVLPNVASPEEVAALLEETAAAVQINRRYDSVHSSEESPSPESTHASNLPAKTSQESPVQQLKEPLFSENRDTSRPEPVTGAIRSHEKTQAGAPVAHMTATTTTLPQIRTEMPQQSVVNPNPESPDAKDTQPRAPEISSTIPKAPNVERSAKAAPDSKSRIEVNFWIIKARKPRLEFERWREGMLRGKSLSFFMEGASKITQSRCIEELKCSLQTFDKLITETIRKDDEKAFEEMKNNFTKHIKLAWEKDRNGKENFEIWIEPVYGDDPSIDGEAEIEDIELGDF